MNKGIVVMSDMTEEPQSPVLKNIVDLINARDDTGTIRCKLFSNAHPELPPQNLNRLPGRRNWSFTAREPHTSTTRPIRMRRFLSFIDEEKDSLPAINIAEDVDIVEESTTNRMHRHLSKLLKSKLFLGGNGTQPLTRTYI